MNRNEMIFVIAWLNAGKTLETGSDTLSFGLWVHHMGYDSKTVLRALNAAREYSSLVSSAKYYK